MPSFDALTQPCENGPWAWNTFLPGDIKRTQGLPWWSTA